MPQLGHDLELSMSQLGLDLHNLLWRGLLMPQLGYDPQPVYQNREQLPSRRKKNGVTISTIVFQFYKFIVDRRSYNS